MNDLTKAAMFWKSLGVATIPVYYKSKQPKIRWINYTAELPSDELLGRWMAGRYSNIAVIAGWNNLCIIDFDDMNSYRQWEAWAESNSPVARHVLATARMALSARGVHIYTFCPDAVNLKLPGIDILADRKYALIPPSIHPTEKRYILLRDSLPACVESIKELFPTEIIDNAISSLPTGQLGSKNTMLPTARYDGNDYDPWSLAGRGSTPTQSVIDKIKSHYRIEDFFPKASYSGGGGRWMLTNCPFHNDRNPSLSIDLEAQTCKCLSSHGCTPLPLDVIGVYAKLHNLTNEQAINEMKERI